MPGLSFNKIIRDCELLTANLPEYLEQYPDLQPDADELDELVAGAKDLDNEQEKLRGRLRQITRLRKDAELHSRDVRSRLVAQLRGKLGFENEQLLELGIPVRRPSRRRKPEPPAPPPPPPVEAQASDKPAEPAG
ncbi:MAG TPA: hypothetical protein VN493_01160 [Thermoanaerobaculia bacterium]|nr:hypothetical protein [Thermoanaerobaculia bacterium]